MLMSHTVCIMTDSHFSLACFSSLKWEEGDSPFLSSLLALMLRNAKPGDSCGAPCGHTYEASTGPDTRAWKPFFPFTLRDLAVRQTL